MTVDPERLKVAMDAAWRCFKSPMDYRDKQMITAAIAALDEHDQQPRAAGNVIEAAIQAFCDSGSKAYLNMPLAERMSRALAAADAAGGRAEPPNITRDETLEEKLADATQRNLILRGAFDRMELKANAAVARLAEIGQSAWEWVGGQDGSIDGGALLRRIHDLATRPFTEAPDPPPDTVPFTREVRELLGAVAFCLPPLLVENGRNVDAEDIQRCALAAFPPNPKDNNDAP